MEKKITKKTTRPFLDALNSERYCNWYGMVEKKRLQLLNKNRGSHSRSQAFLPDFTQHINQEKILYHKLNMQHSKIHRDIPSSEGYSGFPHAVNAKLCPKKRFASVNGRGNKPN